MHFCFKFNKISEQFKPEDTIVSKIQTNQKFLIVSNHGDSRFDEYN